MRNILYLRGMKNEESKLQIECVKWFGLQYPKHIIAAIPNGGKRSKITAGIMKQEGVLKGMPDLIVPHPNGTYCGLFIEMKYGKNKASKEQKELISKLTENGYKVEICYSIDEFMKVCNEYLK